MMRAGVFASLVATTSAHGWIRTPISKNEMANHHYVDGMPESLRYEPQTCYWGNTAGHMESGAGYSCGAKEADSSKGLATWKKWYDAAGVAIPTLTPGQEIEVDIQITADHGGQSWLMIACDDHIGEDVNWTYLERAKTDRDHHFMPSNPGIYAWATSEAASTMNDHIKARWVVPEAFTCSTGNVVGRWLWKTGSSCNDINNIGRPTQTFKSAEYQAVLDDYHSGSWVKAACVQPAETFITCLDFVMSGAPPSPPAPPTPAPPPTPSPPAPPTPAPPAKKPTCCWSNWGDDSTCSEYTGPGGQCNTDHNKKCNSDTECAKQLMASPTPPCPFKQATPECCWSKWGDSSTCGDYVGPGAECNTDHSKKCTSNSDCPATPSPTPPPTPQPPSPTPPTPPTPTPPTPPTPTPPTPPTPTPPTPPSPIPPSGSVEACHEAAKNYCTTKGGFCHACQGWGTWGDMFFTAVCNDDVSTCHQPITAADGSVCFCQRAGGCSAGGATCGGPALLV